MQPDATYRVAGPARHPVAENERVLQFIEALSAAKPAATNALVERRRMMYAAHESYRDNCRLSVPEVNFLVEAVRKRGPENGLYGAKITGGGTGGTVAVFGKIEALKEHIPQIAMEYSRRVGEMPDIFEGTSPGRDRIWRAGAIASAPAAGEKFLPERLPDMNEPGPQSRHSRCRAWHAAFSGVTCCQEEFFPVVGPDGMARALFHYHLLELEAAGIEEICIIVQPGEDELVIRIICSGPDAGYLRRLEKYPALLREAEQMREFAGRVCFAVQREQEGYGHAVFQTKDFCGRRNGAARPGRSFVSRQRGFAVSGELAEIGGGLARRPERFGRQPHLRRRAEGLWHHCRPAPRAIIRA